MSGRLIKGAHVIDPGNGVDEVCDLLIDGGKIISTGQSLDRTDDVEVIDARNRLVIPGLVDSHVHISSCVEGYFMLARAGVTTCLDMMGDPEQMAEGIRSANTGLTVGFLYPLIPEATVSSADPGTKELRDVVGRAVEAGAFGVKVLGGHYPLTPSATRNAVKVADELGVYCAVHAGSTENGSNIKGLEELIKLVDGLPVHIAHINSYCRGQITGNPVEEALVALEMLRNATHIRSESYFGLINGTSADIVHGAPKSNVTKTCLAQGGYSRDRAGMESAIRDGWAQIHGIVGDERVLLPPKEGLAVFGEADTRVSVSFRVNSPAAAITLATAKRDDGSFIVDAISTDGGAIPRNTTLKQGMALVQYGALSMSDLVLKAARNPAMMLGLPQKGHLGIGSDADLVILKAADAIPETVIAKGTPILQNGQLLRQKACKSFHASRSVQS